MKNSILRNLAKTYIWQTKYKASKEIGVCLFKNKEDLSYIQVIFLQWLEIYSQLYADLGMNEKNITENTLKSDIRTDAYLYWRRNKKPEESKKENTTSFGIKYITPKKEKVNG